MALNPLNSSNLEQLASRGLRFDTVTERLKVGAFLRGVSWACWCASRARTKPIYRSKSVTRPSVLCWDLCWSSVSTTRITGSLCPRRNSSKSTRSTRWESPWVRSSNSITTPAFECSAKAHQRSSLWGPSQIPLQICNMEFLCTCQFYVF